MLGYFKAFKEATTKTKFFFLSIIVLFLMLLGSALYPYLTILVNK